MSMLVIVIMMLLGGWVLYIMAGRPCSLDQEVKRKSRNFPRGKSSR